MKKSSLLSLVALVVLLAVSFVGYSSDSHIIKKSEKICYVSGVNDVEFLDFNYVSNSLDLDAIIIDFAKLPELAYPAAYNKANYVSWRVKKKSNYYAHSNCGLFINNFHKNI